MKILSLNFCVTHPRPRSERLKAVADFVQANGVDVLLMQEGVRSCLVYDTGRQLGRLLGPLSWDRYAKSNVAWPFFWEFRVGIFSRHQIIETFHADLSVPVQRTYPDSLPLPWRAHAVGVLIYAPEFGRTLLVDVHLSSGPKTPSDQVDQTRKLLAWIGGLEKADMTILGGDFNFPAGSSSQILLAECGYQPAGASQPDFIFTNGAKVVSSQVVMTDHEITDHPGAVLVEVE